MTEDLYEELQVTNSLSDDNVVKLKGLYIANPNIYLFYPKLVSLYDYMHVQEKELTNYEKLDIALEIAECLKTVHETKNNMIHGHLSSRNLFIEKVIQGNMIKHSVKLGDLGDLSVRQSAKIFLGYEIRNTWSSPEVINDPNLVFTDKKQSLDIYSYGMLLWEIFSNIVPFADNIDAAKVFVVEKNCRPKIRYNGDVSDEEEDDAHPNKGKC